MDSLSPLLERFTLSARVFFAGALCGASSFERQAGLGTIHVLRRGRLRVAQEGGGVLEVEEPSVLFYPQPCAHGFQVDQPAGAELACAWIDFGAALGNPVLRGLPELMVVPLARIPGIDATLASLFEEAFADRPGRQAVLNRLLEYVLVLLLRYGMEIKTINGSVLAALGDPRLGKALLAMHARPDHPWSLESLAGEAGMSRARFAAHFHSTVGATPLDYLTDWRISVAQTLLRRGRSLKMIAPMVGYASAVAFTRVFSRRVGTPPTDWLARITAPAEPPDRG
jgi:AraC-like DNA-binding protein